MTVAAHKIGFRSGRRAEAETPSPVARPSLPRFALVADAAEARPNEEIVADLAAVAEEYAPEGGYGETAWNAETGTVFWVCGDWTSDEELEAAETAFRAVEGVREFEHEAEAGLPEGDAWERVWPPAEAEEASAPAETLGGPQEAPEGLTEAVVDLPAPARGGRSVQLAAMMKAMTEMFALALENDEPAQPQQLHVHLSPQPVHVDIAAPPPAPAAPAPDVHVTVEPAKIEAPDVHVTFEAPAAPAAPAPTVVVRNEVPVPEVRVDVQPTPVEVAAPSVTVENNVEVPRPGPIRVETEEDGTRVYIPEPAE